MGQIHRVRGYKYEVRKRKSGRKIAYTMEGYYIGSAGLAKELIGKRGIAPEPTKENLKIAEESANPAVCSVGYSSLDQKWYGWSHRAIFGFGIGHMIKKGDIGYVPSEPKDLIKEMTEQLEWASCEIVEVKIGKYDGAITIIHDETMYAYKMDEGGDLVQDGEPVLERREWCKPLGMGEWRAETEADCKRMAEDFAGEIG